MYVSLKRNTVGACLCLGLLTALCYWPVTSNGFVYLDDATYVFQNIHIKAGINFRSLAWAFTSGYASNWHPLTWISHAADIQLFGLNAGGHHLTSLVIHCCNGVLLFLLLRSITGAFWRSAVVAALFAWHPTHVESVAWAAERKDVLSTFFFLLTLWAYARYAQEKLKADNAPSAEGGKSKPGSFGRQFYWVSLSLFALGLMSKPMLVTLPCVLLLLDFWPLGRFTRSATPTSEDCNVECLSPGKGGYGRTTGTMWRLVMEKAPFFALSFVASVITFVAQKEGGAVSSLTAVPLAARVANMVVSYSRYLIKVIWPVDLAVFYPLPSHWPWGYVAGSFMLLVALSVVFIFRSKRNPYLLVGWCWFIGTLVPTIGLVQVGSQSMADRYLYIPSIGLFVMLVWGVYDLRFGRRGDQRERTSPDRGIPSVAANSIPEEPVLWIRRNWALITLVGSFLAACLVCTALQVRYWHDEETLFRHAMEVTTDNYLAYDHLAKVYENDGRKDQALFCYHELLRLKPKYPEGQYNAGTLLMGMGRLNEAIPHFEAAIQIRPAFAQAHSNLGLSLLRLGRIESSVQQLEEASHCDPFNPDAFVNLGVGQLAAKRPGDASRSFDYALRLNPNLAEVQFLLALALSRDHKTPEALVHAGKARDLAVANGQSETVLKANELLKVFQSGTVDQP